MTRYASPRWMAAARVPRDARMQEGKIREVREGRAPRATRRDATADAKEPLWVVFGRKRRDGQWQQGWTVLDGNMRSLWVACRFFRGQTNPRHFEPIYHADAEPHVVSHLSSPIASFPERRRAAASNHALRPRGVLPRRLGDVWAGAHRPAHGTGSPRCVVLGALRWSRPAAASLTGVLLSHRC